MSPSKAQHTALLIAVAICLTHIASATLFLPQHLLGLDRNKTCADYKSRAISCYFAICHKGMVDTHYSDDITYCSLTPYFECMLQNIRAECIGAVQHKLMQAGLTLAKLKLSAICRDESSIRKYRTHRSCFTDKRRRLEHRRLCELSFRQATKAAFYIRDQLDWDDQSDAICCLGSLGIQLIYDEMLRICEHVTGPGERTSLIAIKTKLINYLIN